MTDPFRSRLAVGAIALATLVGLVGCGDELCEDAQAVCSAAESSQSFDADCPDEPTECLASCVVDAADCSAEALTRCNEICGPFVAQE